MSEYVELFCITVLQTSQPFQSSCPCLKIHFKVRVDTLSNYLLEVFFSFHVRYNGEGNIAIKSQIATIWRYLRQNWKNSKEIYFVQRASEAIKRYQIYFILSDLK